MSSYLKNGRTSMAKNKNFELTKSDFDPRNVKERISIMLDQDIVDHFRKRASKENSKYQTLINAALREHMGQGNTLEERLSEIEEKLSKLTG